MTNQETTEAAAVVVANANTISFLLFGQSKKCPLIWVRNAAGDLVSNDASYTYRVSDHRVPNQGMSDPYKLTIYDQMTKKTKFTDWSCTELGAVAAACDIAIGVNRV